MKNILKILIHSKISSICETNSEASNKVNVFDFSIISVTVDISINSKNIST